jgi:hypothetical protein
LRTERRRRRAACHGKAGKPGNEGRMYFHRRSPR